ncbi:MAG: hypothetical protein MI924_19680 [Chloroflexales bacterium]|nr:hypothetical protein [Chloroflexales bacterium]
MFVPLIPGIPFFVLGAALFGDRESLMPASLNKRRNHAARFPTLQARIHHILGWCCVSLGVIGLMIPWIPLGIPFMACGVALLGRRDPALRWYMVLIELKLRRLARIRHPMVAWSGRRVRRMYRRVSRRFRMAAPAAIG